MLVPLLSAACTITLRDDSTSHQSGSGKLLSGEVASDAGTHDATPDGASDASTSAGFTTLAEACTAIAKSQCARLDACKFTRLFTDAADCITRSQMMCEKSYGADGVGAKPADLGGCPAAWGTLACGDLERTLPDACVRPGSRASGEACGESLQCASGLCEGSTYVWPDVKPGAQCGHCAEPIAEGDACTSSTTNCAMGSICIGLKCKRYLGVGESSGVANTYCRSDLTYYDYACTVPTGEGTPCVYNGPHGGQVCDTNQGLTCNHPGGLDQPGTCTRLPPIVRTSDGAACDPAGAALCELGSSCVDGTCRVDDPNACR